MTGKKLRVLVATHIGEPIGGITINYRNLLASSFTNLLEVSVVETSQGILAFSQRGRWRLNNWLDGLRNLKCFLQAVRRERPDLVYIGSSYGASFLKHGLMALCAYWMGILVVMQVHCSITQLLPARRTFWHHYVLFVLKRVHGIVTLSREWDAILELLPDARICYVPNAIDLRPYLPLPRPQQKPAKQVDILFLGHIGREKGCFDLIPAVDLLRQQTNISFCLHFVGETLHSGEKSELQSQVNMLGLKEWVQIHEPAYGDRKTAHFAESDILVLPSFHEGMPMVIIEAMAAGLPVIASRVGGIPEQIDPGQTGLLIEAGDVVALTNSLLYLIENPNERIRMGLEGRRHAIEQFDIETKASQLVSFFHQLTDQIQ